MWKTLAGAKGWPSKLPVIRGTRASSAVRVGYSPPQENVDGLWGRDKALVFVVIVCCFVVPVPIMAFATLVVCRKAEVGH